MGLYTFKKAENVFYFISKIIGILWIIQHTQIYQHHTPHKSINIIHHINKSQKPHGHLNRCRKSVGQNPTSVYYKNSATKVGIGGTYLNIIKAIYDKPTANIIVSGKKAENLPTKICNKTRMPTLNTFIQHCIGSLSHRNTHIYVCVCVCIFST